MERSAWVRYACARSGALGFSRVEALCVRTERRARFLVRIVQQLIPLAFNRELQVGYNR
jgi:hypothetical protein